MPELNTKQKILATSVQLFNQFGLANVRLQQIATEVGISPGNLAYHFRNKEAIIEAVYLDLFEELREILATYRVFPNMIDFDYQMNKYFVFIQKYPFYFIDIQEISRQFPEIDLQRGQLTVKMVNQIRKRFDFKKQRGMMVEEPLPGIYEYLAKSVWCLISSEAHRQMTNSSTDWEQENNFKKMIWYLLFPYFTKEGLEEFKQLIVPSLEHPSSRV
ncbi:MAG TPA: TetR/AcrR family transcriptional regulator [Saprospiraceae bacterium]|nr:TetR/AcrR family transcriptional regulator [Saprospiraceae bacterium]HMQ82558.1 TetR/AcrR family transcriptional regulator [Saprospiraceae bacterium]